MSERDHLFVNYATEDGLFAEWLALRLTSEGYKVWIDRFKLLGGESYPRDIDVAIKNRTFRFLSLLSKSSIAKPNPMKERTLALNLAKLPGMTGFVVPLNVEGMSATELDWLTSDITFIPFHASWQKGLVQLLKLLDRENCPKFAGDGRAIVSDLALTSELIVETPDILTSNTCAFSQIPKRLYTYVVSPSLADSRRVDVLRDWACYPITPHRVVAFHPPDGELLKWFQVDEAQRHEWQEKPEIEGVPTNDIIAALLRRCIEVCCRRKGFLWNNEGKVYCCRLPFAKRLPIRLSSGEKTTVQSSGSRTYFRVGAPKAPYRFRLAVSPTVIRNFIDGDYSLIWKLRIWCTDETDKDLPSARRLSRRKHCVRNWNNRHWLVRHLGIIQYLADLEGCIRAGDEGPQQVVLDCSPYCFTAPKGIDESKLKPDQEISDEVPFDDALEEFDEDATNEE